jgi:hypothetical protein
MNMYPVLKHHAMKTYGEVAVKIHVFLTLVLDGGNWSASSPGRFTPGERAAGTHRKGGWVGPRARLDAVANRKDPFSAPAGNRTPDAKSIA